MNTMTDAAGKVQGWAFCRAAHVRQRAKELLQEESAQGTTEYAILVGVLVVIAIIAIVAFKGKVKELWDAISEGINACRGRAPHRGAAGVCLPDRGDSGGALGA